MRANILNKKGQLEIGIKIMVMIVFLVLLIISLVVYFKFSYVSIKETKEEILDEKFSSLVNVIANLPELKCSVRNAEKECLDAKKLIAFGETLNENSVIKGNYYEIFGVKKIVVEMVYPEVTLEVDCVDNYNFYPECRKFTLFSIGEDKGLKYTTPISIYFPIINEYKIGKLIITAQNE